MQAISQGITQAQDYFKQQSEKQKLIKKSDVQIDAALKLFPDLAPTLQGVRDQIKDQNISIDERAGIAESVAGLINMGTTQMMANSELGLKNRQLDIQKSQYNQDYEIAKANAIAKKIAEQSTAPTTKEIPVPGGTQTVEWNSDTGSWVPITISDKATATRIENASSLGSPPMDIYTTQGVIIPENEGIVSADGETVDYRGIRYNIDKSVLPALNKDKPTPIGFAPAKIEDKYVPFTDEQISRFKSDGVVNVRTGEPKLINPPAGTELVTENGKTTFKFGSGVGGTGGKESAVKLGEGQQLVPDPNSPTGSRIVQTPSELINKSKDDFSGYVSQIVNSYAGLDRMGKAVTGNNSNPMNYLESTEGGQVLARMFGSDPQVLRDRINTMRPNIINVIRKSSEIGAKGMDSEKELSFYLGALGDPKIPVEANIKALDILDKVYGNGKAVNAIISDFPELKKRVDKYDLQFKSSSTNTDKESNATGSGSEDIYREFGIQ
jgi:hypothetical protein